MLPRINSTRSRLFLSLIVALLFLCMCLALLGLLRNTSVLDSSVTIEGHLLLLALPMQLLASLLFIEAWRRVLAMQSASRFSLSDCTAQIGVTLLGKYLPGKIWGLVGRSFLLTRSGVTPGLALNLLIADQFITFYTGALLGLSGLLVLVNTTWGVVAAITGILAYPFVLKNYQTVFSVVTRILRRLTHRLTATVPDTGSMLDRPGFYTAFASYIAHWIITSLVLCILFYPAIAPDLVSNMTVIIAAIPLAMLLGFVAFWAPGGIGVREGAIVAILSLQIPVEVAALMAIYYRIICVIIDLVIGGFAVIYLVSRAPDLVASDVTES